MVLGEAAMEQAGIVPDILTLNQRVHGSSP